MSKQVNEPGVEAKTCFISDAAAKESGALDKCVPTEMNQTTPRGVIVWYTVPKDITIIIYNIAGLSQAGVERMNR